jgi:hypothetical protein
VSTEIRHNPELDAETRSPWSLAAFALVAGLLQIVASIVLGLARLDRFTAAAGENSTAVMVVAVLVAVGGLSIWMVRERPQIAFALAVLWPTCMWYGLRGHVSVLGLAYHGEFILHHFAALLCLVLALMVPIGWAFDKRLGPWRFAPMLLAIPGALGLALAHLGQVPVGPAWWAGRGLSTTSAALLLATWPVSAALFWRKLGPTQRRLLVFVLMIPIVVRVGFAGPHGLSGELVDGVGIPAIGAAIIVTAIAVLVLLRPRVELWVMIIVGLICLAGSMFFYYLYVHAFGELEDGLGGLLQSLFGFVVPYPSYVDELRSAAMMMGMFFMFVTAYSALVSAEDRVRGIAIGLMIVAGLGFSSPHLVLMLGVGALLVIEGMLPGAPYRELEARFDLRRFEAELEAEFEANDPANDGVGELASVRACELASVRACVEGLADRLGLEPPTVVIAGPGVATISLRGEIDDTVLDLRARVEPRATRIELSVGLPGRGEPTFELIPDRGKRGLRPTHLLARSHRLLGEMRALEAFGDAPLDALSSFPTAYLRAWDGGVQVDLGRELHGLRVDNLEALVRALRSAC